MERWEYAYEEEVHPSVREISKIVRDRTSEGWRWKATIDGLSYKTGHLTLVFEKKVTV